MASTVASMIALATNRTGSSDSRNLIAPRSGPGGSARNTGAATLSLTLGDERASATISTSSRRSSASASEHASSDAQRGLFGNHVDRIHVGMEHGDSAKLLQVSGKCVDHIRIEMLAATFDDDVARALEGERLLVHTPARQRVEHIGQRHQTR